MNRVEIQGKFSWCELATTDVAAATAFYEKLLGWTFEHLQTEGGDSYTVIKVEDEPVGGICPMPETLPSDTTPHWGAYVSVDDVDATAVAVPSLGGTVLLPPTDIPGYGRFCVFRDPQGAVLRVITYAKRGDG